MKNLHLNLKYTALAAAILTATSAWADVATPEATPMLAAAALNGPATEANAAPVAEASAPTSPAAAAVAPAVTANHATNWLGAYLVGQFGQSKADASDQVPSGGTDTAGAVKLGAGYRFNRLVAVEAAATYVGRFNLDGTKADASGVQVDAAFSLPLNYIYGTLSETDNAHDLYDRTSLYVKLGASALSINTDTGRESSVSPSFAVGVETNLNCGYAMRAEFQRTTVEYASKDVDIDVISIGVLKALR